MTRPEDAYGDIPFRIRVGVVGAAVIADGGAVAAKIRQVLAEDIPNLFAANTRLAIQRASHTPASSQSPTAGGCAGGGSSAVSWRSACGRRSF